MHERGPLMDSYVFGKLASFRRDDIARERGVFNLRRLFGKRA